MAQVITWAIVLGNAQLISRAVTAQHSEWQSLPHAQYDPAFHWSCP